MNKNLENLVCAFVDYDAKITGNQEKRSHQKVTIIKGHVLRKIETVYSDV